VDSDYLQRQEIISSYVWNGAVVGYQNGQSPEALSKPGFVGDYFWFV
jgi:hypothetical protein